MGAFLDGDWDSLCKLFTVDESPHLAGNFLEYSSPVSEQDDDLKFPVLSHNVKQHSFSSINDWISNPTPSFLNTKNTDYAYSNNSSDNCAADNFFSGDILSCIDFSMVNAENDGLSSPALNNIVLNHNNNHNNNSSSNNNFCSDDKLSPNTELCLKRKRDAPVIQECLMETPKKNARVSKDSKKKRRTNQKCDEKISTTVNTKDSIETADSISDDSNVCASEEITETEDSNSNLTVVSLTSTGKKRANRGAATDPQSLYARKRRMRINERLKILQTLVPNGTKVDISTMLEEAFHYVKFLQLQIRLLSSDDLWMYAPLAYNGFDVGAYRKIPSLSPFLGL
nr:hypothetical protein [Suaeda aralocaspica]